MSQSADTNLQGREKYWAWMRRYMPEFSDGAKRLREIAGAPGALDFKTKELLILALNINNDRSNIARVANRARAAGATNAEIAEVIAVCYFMAGGNRLATASPAMDFDEE